MSFSNPILAGEELVRNAIRSENFVAGVSGWRIARDGTAEFSDTIIRGSITARGAIYTANVFDGRMNIYLNSDTDELTEWSTGALQFFPIDGSSGLLLDYDGPNALGFRVSGGDPQGVYFDRTTKFIYKTKSAGSYTPEVWNALPNNNGYAGGAYKLLPDGNVILDGGVGGGVAASPIQIGTLPVGYRPRGYGEYMVARGGAFGTNKITIDAAGVVTQWSPDATYNSYLSGIMFSTLA
jgi:hypothetical protein